MKPELKACPFCGIVPKVEIFEDGWHRKKFGIVCENDDCYIQPFTAWCAEKDDVIKEWNRRATDDHP